MVYTTLDVSLSTVTLTCYSLNSSIFKQTGMDLLPDLFNKTNPLKPIIPDLVDCHETKSLDGRAIFAM